MIKSLLGACALAALACTPSAQAATFKLSPNNKSIVMTGDIVEGDVQRFATAIRTANRNGVIVERIFLNSTGGVTRVAYFLGSGIISTKLDTVVGASDICA